MSKNTLKKEINEISKFSKNIPSLMETIHFSPEREMEMAQMCEEDDEIEGDSVPMDMEPEIQEELPGKQIVDQIRKMALKAMAELADHTEDSYYLVLKKIWQMADKNPEENKMNKGE